MKGNITRRGKNSWRIKFDIGRDVDTVRLLVASKAGSETDPIWYANLCDEPAVHVRVGADVYPAVAGTLSVPERTSRSWPPPCSSGVHSTSRPSSNAPTPIGPPSL